jgi:hypothetical protein
MMADSSACSLHLCPFIGIESAQVVAHAVLFDLVCMRCAVMPPTLDNIGATCLAFPTYPRKLCVCISMMFFY